MKFYSNLFFAFFLIFFVSCATQKKEEPMTPAMQEKEIYDQAQERIKSKNYSMAIDALESLERRFPFGKYAEQAQAERFTLTTKMGFMKLLWLQQKDLSACTQDIPIQITLTT